MYNDTTLICDIASSTSSISNTITLVAFCTFWKRVYANHLSVFDYNVK